MAPKYRTGSSKKQKDAIGNRHYSLRVIATASAACGLLINMVAIANIGRINRGHAARVLISWAFLPVSDTVATCSCVLRLMACSFWVLLLGMLDTSR